MKLNRPVVDQSFATYSHLSESLFSLPILYLPILSYLLCSVLSPKLESPQQELGVGILLPVVYVITFLNNTTFYLTGGTNKIRIFFKECQLIDFNKNTYSALYSKSAFIINGTFE